MQIMMVGASICQTVDKPWITVEIEDYRFAQGKQAVEIPV